MASNQELFILHTFKIIRAQFDKEWSPMQPLLGRNSIKTEKCKYQQTNQLFKNVLNQNNQSNYTQMLLILI